MGLMNDCCYISIIVPVDKTDKYLSRCIDSILAQTYNNFELLLIDDGSPDNCGKICDKYALYDTRIKVFHVENNGVTAARKLGVMNSTGEWICFVYSDDTIPEKSLEILQSHKNNSDIIVVNRYDLSDTNGRFGYNIENIKNTDLASL